MKKYMLIIAALLGSMVMTAQNMESVKITHGPWLCDMTENAVTVVWKTDVPATGWVEFTENHGQHFYSEEHERVYDARFGRRLTHETIHSVRLTGLKPGTNYMYRIFSQALTGWGTSDDARLGEIASSVVYKKEPYGFRTFSNDTDELKFFILNDVHGRSDDIRRLCADVDFSQYDFVLLNGDMLTTTENEEQIFNGWLDACVDMFAKNVPIVYVRGNHENRGQYADNMYKYFPSHNGQFYCTFDAAGISFLALDCGEDKPDSDIEYHGILESDKYREQEAAWLENEIGNLRYDKRIAILHIPAGNTTWHGDIHLHNLITPLLNEAGVSLMFSGHTHQYAVRKAGELADFPVLINGNRTYASVTVKGKKIHVEVIGETKEENHSLDFQFR